jgi:hypothetical protein
VLHLPDYRILKVQSQGNFVGPGRQLRNGDIPLGHVFLGDPETRALVETMYLTQGVGVYEDMLKQKVDRGAFRVPWPADTTTIMANRIYEGMQCIQAWRVLPKNSLVNLLGTVRSCVLDFVLELEEESPRSW